MVDVTASSAHSSGCRPPALARQADPGLERLLATVLNERGAMTAELRVRPPSAVGQIAARQRLLSSLEAYTAALATRGLSAPPKLRDELALQRRLAGHYTS